MLDVAGGAAAAAAALTLAVGSTGLARRARGLRPWLLVLVDVNAGRAPRTALRGVVPVDVLLLVLATVTYLGFWPGPGTAHVGWMALAVGQPLVGIPLLLATRLQGRSGLMGGAAILSVLLLVDGVAPVAGWLGASAATLLLVADLGTTGRPSRVRTACLVLGYGALVLWLAWLAGLLLT